ncbi:MAG: biotin--[acetyl-CoA-carboxylase] ligase [Planctomycetota bacterium]
MTHRRATRRRPDIRDPLADVLAVLYDRGEAYVAPDELAAATGLSGSQLSDALEKLRRRGCGIEQSPAEGLRLLRPTVLHPVLIEPRLETRRVGRSVICFDEVDSTNDVTFDSACRDDSDGLAVFAEAQRSGRGRLGRGWVSQPGRNVLMSVLLSAGSAAKSHEALTVAAGLAVAEALDAFGVDCLLKWPNDVLLDTVKVAGVMVELRDGCAVIGCGVNVNAAPPAGEVDFPATCLAETVGHPLERAEVAREMLRRLDEWVEHVETGRFGPLHDAFTSRCATINRRVEVRCGRRKYAGRALDVSPLEGLVLLSDEGRRLHVPAAGSTILSWK